jgi:hypothetical protein
LSHVTKSAHPMVLPPCLRKLARYCACQVAPLSCFSKHTHTWSAHQLDCSSTLARWACQVTPPSHVQVDCSSMLTKLTLCVFSSSHPTKAPHQGRRLHVRSPSRFAMLPRRVASLIRPSHLPHQLATLSRLPMSARQADNSSSLTKSPPPVNPTGRLFESSHQVGSPNGSTTLPQKVGSLLCLPSCPTELLL